MSDDPNFKNPSITGNWTGGVHYWKCPRCHSEDVYKAKQQLGTGGPIQEIGDSGNYIGTQRAMFSDIWKCRACGEIATKFTRDRTPTEKLRDTQIRRELNAATPPSVYLTVLFLIVFVTGTILYVAS